MRIALASCRPARGRDDDEEPLRAALARRGAHAEPAEWDDPGVDWGAFDLVAVRSTWDYPARRGAFLAWAEAVAVRTRLVNPPAVLAWSTDKSYLGRLADAGIPVVATRILGPGGTGPLPEGELVVKPRIGAGAAGALRAGPGEHARARAHARALQAAGRGAIVQPYIGGVERHGETALVYLGGTLSHAARKGPLLRPGAAPHEELFAEEDIAARRPDAAEQAVGAAVMRHLGRLGMSPAYARVDLLPGDGGPLVLEVELAEPSLFLALSAGAADRLAELLMAGAHAS